MQHPHHEINTEAGARPAAITNWKITRDLDTTSKKIMASTTPRHRVCSYLRMVAALFLGYHHASVSPG